MVGGWSPHARYALAIGDGKMRGCGVQRGPERKSRKEGSGGNERAGSGGEVGGGAAKSKGAGSCTTTPHRILQYARHSILAASILGYRGEEKRELGEEGERERGRGGEDGGVGGREYRQDSLEGPFLRVQE